MMWSLYEIEVKFPDGAIWYRHGQVWRDRDKVLADRDRLQAISGDTAEYRVVEVRRKVIR